MWWALPKNESFSLSFPRKRKFSRQGLLLDSCRRRHDKLTIIFVFVVVISISFTACRKPNPKARLYLASSLSVMLLDIETLAHRSEPVEVMFLSSSAIARQVMSGAECDAMVLADEQWYHFLLKHQAISPDSMVLAHNRLVLVGDKNAKPMEFSQAIKILPKSAKLIVGDDQLNPLGVYTKEALLTYGFYTNVQEKLYRAPSARLASVLLKEGLSSWGVIYLTDALSDHHHIVAHIDQVKHRPITYPFIPCKDARRAKVQAIKRLLFSPEFKQALKNKGFMLD